MQSAKRWVRRLVVTVVAPAVLLTGCATTVEDPGTQSEALQLARAVGLTKLNDIDRGEYAAAIRKQPNMDASNAINLVAVGSGAVDPLTGWTAGAQFATFGVLSILASGSGHAPEQDDRFLVWMPKDLAKDKQAAAVYLKDTIEAAYRRALPEYEVDFVARKSIDTWAGTMDLAIRGPQCKYCKVFAPEMFDWLKEPKMGQAPGRLGGYEAYTWPARGVRSDSRFQGFPMNGGDHDAEQRMDILVRLSEELPPWIYVYVAPREGLTGIPLILDNGRPLLFLTPQA